MREQRQATGRDWRADPRPGDVIVLRGRRRLSPRLIARVNDDAIETSPIHGGRASRGGHTRCSRIARTSLHRYDFIAEAGPKVPARRAKEASDADA